jgi:hypothetical protein
MAEDRSSELPDAAACRVSDLGAIQLSKTKATTLKQITKIKLSSFLYNFIV